MQPAGTRKTPRDIKFLLQRDARPLPRRSGRRLGRADLAPGLRGPLPPAMSSRETLYFSLIKCTAKVETLESVETGERYYGTGPAAPRAPSPCPAGREIWRGRLGNCSYFVIIPYKYGWPGGPAGTHGSQRCTNSFGSTGNTEALNFILLGRTNFGPF